MKLNPHLHGVFLDGVYVPGTDGAPEFRALPRLSTTDVTDALQVARARILRYLEKSGVITLDSDANSDALCVSEELAERDPALSQLAAAAVSGLAPAGPELRRKPRELAFAGRPGVVIHAPLSVREAGFSLQTDQEIGQTCVSTSDCPDTLGCYNCLPTCSTPSDCASGSVCKSQPTSGGSTRSVCFEDPNAITMSGTKLFGQACSSANDCSDDDARCEGYCTNSCAGDFDCSSGTRTAGRCVSGIVSGSSICLPGCEPGYLGLDRIPLSTGSKRPKQWSRR